MTGRWSKLTRGRDRWPSLCGAVMLTFAPQAIQMPDSAPADNNASAVRRFQRMCDGLRGAERLIADLDADSFHAREMATRKLLEMPLCPRTALRNVLQNGSPESKFRARLVLTQRGGDSDEGLERMLEQVRRNRIKGVAPQIFELMPLFPDAELHWSMVTTLAMTVEPDDVDRAREHLKSSQPRLREAAVMALGALKLPKLAEEILPLANDPDQRVRVAVAGALAELNHPGCLEVLIGLLASNDRKIRTDAEIMLQKLTGQDFGFFAARDDDQREIVIARWQTWISKTPTPLQRPTTRTYRANPFD